MHYVLAKNKILNKVNGSRIKITLNAGKSGVINFQYHHQLLGLIYNFLKSSDPDYSIWLHDEGYVVPTNQLSFPPHKMSLPPLNMSSTSNNMTFSPPNLSFPRKRESMVQAKQSHKQFKLFCISGITFRCRVRPTREGLCSLKRYDDLRFCFEISSPVQQFIQHLVVGLFERADSIYIGNTSANIETVESLPDIQPNCYSDSTKCHSRENGNPIPPPFSKGDTGGFSITLKPLESPIFIKKPMPYGERDQYLFPDDKEFTYYLNKNLKDKYFALFGEPCPYDDLDFDFNCHSAHDAESIPPFSKGARGDLDCHSRENGNPVPPPLTKGDSGGFSKKTPTEKVIEVRTKSGKSIKIKGTLKPFTVTGNSELIKIGLYCGFGANNSVGCGYVELVE